MSKFNVFKSLSVLYAEDDTILREITQKTLELVVGKVFAVESGEEAVEIYHHHKIDIVMLDIHMGDVSGIEVAQKIRETNDKVPIVIISGSLATTDLLEACKLNLVEYIQKPIEFNALMKVLGLAVERLKSQGMMVAKITDSCLYDFFAKSLIVDNNMPIALTKNEILVLEFLLSNRGQVVSYERFSHLFEEFLSDGALKNLILRLRKKMGDDAPLRNLAKIGYVLA